LFDDHRIVGAEDTELHKPHPDVFLEAARRIEIAPERCRVYEDADLGIEAAGRAGMECFDVRTKAGEIETLDEFRYATQRRPLTKICEEPKKGKHHHW